jgi:hypothetical protein
MLTLLDNAGTYALPTSWQEVSTKQYCDLDRLQLRTVEARASYFAGRPIQVNGIVADALAWMLHDVPLDTDTLRYPGELDKETFGQVEAIRRLLLKQPLHQCFTEVYGIFVARARDVRSRSRFDATRAATLSQQALALPIVETYPALTHCLRELERIATVYAALNEPDFTEAGRRAREAGSERLAEFGHFNVAYYYSQKLGCSLEDIYQMPYATVAQLLLHDRISAEIQDVLSRPNHD